MQRIAKSKYLVIAGGSGYWHQIRSNIYTYSNQKFVVILEFVPDEASIVCKSPYHSDHYTTEGRLVLPYAEQIWRRWWSSEFGNLALSAWIVY